MADGDGCPDPDDDGDGVLDVNDLCRRQPEDHDGFEDKDGCPDPDNDQDRIADKKDVCPNHAEVYNGFEDDDGCPDPTPYDSDRHPSFTDNLFMVRPVFFAQGAARLSPVDVRYLTKFSRWLVSEPSIEVLAVVGHASVNERRPIDLGRQRARAVAALLGRKTGKRRLREYSAGTKSAAEWAVVSRPIWKDRSVHFRYFRLAGKEIYRWNGTLDVPVVSSTR